MKIEKDAETRTVTLAPKGLIFLALGGYLGEANGKPVKENTEAVIKALVDFMTKNEMGLIVDEGKLTFINVKEKPIRKKILGIF